ncbi:MAG: tetratricopeptide repeat protein [Syntrophobacteraceae bacterium]
MKKTKAFYLVVIFAVSALLLSAVNARAVSEEARRHMDRGQAAIEMAKSPDEYAPAIKEFEQAIRLAPTWPAPYYNLGIAQEKAGKFREAVTNLQQYLRLAPNASDAKTVKSLINKLEYKAESVLTVADITSVLSSFWDWKMTGDCWLSYKKLNYKMPYIIKRVGDDSLEVCTAIYEGPRHCLSGDYLQTMKVDGPIFRFTHTYSTCGPGDAAIVEPGDVCSCPTILDYEIEVLSRDKVKMTQTVNGIGVDVKGWSRCTDPARHYSCVFVRE